MPAWRNVLSLCLSAYVFLFRRSLCTATDNTESSCPIDRNLFFPKDTCPLEKLRYLQCNFKHWRFDKTQVLISHFPLDSVLTNYVREVRNAVFSITYPIPFKTNLYLVSYSKSVLNDVLDLSQDVINHKDFIDFVSGHITLRDVKPLSHRYGGHQFGYWADQLGDGRAVMLGEHVNYKGVRWELQLKGSGKTPYSRQGDGRAVLRSSVREFLCSEAMYHLGIPTSRAATLVVTDDPVIRDQFYDGNPKRERGAVVLRLAQSWFRIGSLEILEHNKEYDLLKKMVDFVIKNYFPSVNSSDNENKYLAFYSEVVTATAEMIALWQSVGFTHGVCNTDNFSLLSITIDYGPFGFMEEYDPTFVPNTSDDEGRYSYEHQPDIGIFNLEKLGVAIQPLLQKKHRKHLKQILKGYVEIYKSKFMILFRRKLGLNKNVGDDENFVAIFLKMMQETKSDFTMSFRELGEINLHEIKKGFLPSKLWALQRLSKHKWFWDWIAAYKNRIKRENISEEDRQSKMNKTNPRYVLRNWMAQDAIEKADVNNFSVVNKIARILETPFEFSLEAEEMGYAAPPPWWSKSLKVSCSS